MRALLLILLALPSWGAITRVHVPASTSPCSKTTNNSVALTCSTTVPPGVGNALIVMVWAGGSLSSTTVADNATGGTNTYTQRVSTTSPELRHYSANMARTSAGTFTVTVTPSGNASLSVWFAEYGGIDATQIDDTAGGTAGSAGVRQCGSTDTLTTTNANDLIVAGLMAGGATNLTVDSANPTYTMSALSAANEFASTFFAGFMDKIGTSTVSALNLKFDGQGGYSSACTVVAYKATASATTPIRHKVIQ